MTPYVTAGVTQLRAPDGSLQTLKSLGRVFCTERHPECGYNGGVDVKFSLTPSLTLDATYRTDFAQAEVDQQQVNLTRFNLFFPEKRDFFIENATTFNFGEPAAAMRTWSHSLAAASVSAAPAPPFRLPVERALPGRSIVTMSAS